MNTTRTGLRTWRNWIALPSLLITPLAVHAQTTPKAEPCTAKEIAAKDPRCPEELQEVVVTGSRIARPDLDRLEPTTTVDARALDVRGILDVGQALNELPQFSVSPSSAANTQSGFGIAQSFVDLYGLGSQRTLVLVNSRRFVSAILRA
jgi:outer membrane cobalamin receptor